MFSTALVTYYSLFVIGITQKLFNRVSQNSVETWAMAHGRHR